MRQIIAAIFGILLLPLAAYAGPGVQGDPCENPMGSRYSVPLNVTTTAGTTQIVAAVTSSTQSGSAIDVCGCTFEISGSASATAEFEYGTGTNCATSPTALTGTYLGSATGVVIPMAGGYTMFAAPQGTALCLVAGGTTPTIQGVCTYSLQ